MVFKTAATLWEGITIVYKGDMALKQRAITSVVLISFVLFALFALRLLEFVFFLSLIICVGGWEWGKLSGLRVWQSYVYLLLLAGIFFVLYRYGNTSLQHIIVFIGAAWWCASVLLLLHYQRNGVTFIQHAPLLKIAMGLLSLIPMWSALLLLYTYEPRGKIILLFLLILTWAADGGAYFTGRKWGERALAKKISPGKTWEGVWGGFCISLLFSMVYIFFAPVGPMNTWLFISICVLTILFSVVGDLLESMLKRLVGLQDSSNILPGHGGVLDRIDSLAAASTIFVASLLITGLLG